MARDIQFHEKTHRPFLIPENNTSIEVTNRRLALAIAIEFIDIALTAGRKVLDVQAYGTSWEDILTLQTAITDILVIRLDALMYFMEWYPSVPLKTVRLEIRCINCGKVKGNTDNPVLEMEYHLHHKVKRIEGNKMNKNKKYVKEVLSRVLSYLTLVWLGIVIEYGYELYFPHSIRAVCIFAVLCVVLLIVTYCE